MTKLLKLKSTKEILDVIIHKDIDSPTLLKYFSVLYEEYLMFMSMYDYDDECILTPTLLSSVDVKQSINDEELSEKVYNQLLRVLTQEGHKSVKALLDNIDKYIVDAGLGKIFISKKVIKQSFSKKKTDKGNKMIHILEDMKHKLKYQCNPYDEDEDDTPKEKSAIMETILFEVIADAILEIVQDEKNEVSISVSVNPGVDEEISLEYGHIHAPQINKDDILEAFLDLSSFIHKDLSRDPLDRIDDILRVFFPERFYKSIIKIAEDIAFSGKEGRIFKFSNLEREVGFSDFEEARTHFRNIYYNTNRPKREVEMIDVI